ncbi:GbsR/MarR family transcriptional regulator [Paenibacillus ginsengarvi]|uniref:GbsR/MarR family transcriptional regulator n=1 Tax=Paenibacillus ginsengarvi TaxID=400777 RepID=UPI0013154435|nr:HTH domain-containing protein [Paenibacillus ginsengarvi]
MGESEFERFRSEWTERMALLFEESGTSPLVGRIYALLMSSPEPVSLQLMSEKLGVTKAAVSIQVRTLERYGHCMKLPRGKDRKDYYCIPEDHLQASMRMVTTRLHSEMNYIEETLRKMPDPDRQAPNEQKSLQVLRQRYSELLAFYRVVFRRLEGVEEEMERLIADLRAQPEQDR